MSRVQLALNVSDVDAAVAFYSKLFGAEPAKRRPGYANFAIAEPPLKLVLIESGATPGTLNHLGVEVEDQAQVQAAITSFAAQEVPSDVEDGVTCCYAVQDKVWVTGPGKEPWEVYVVKADADTLSKSAANTAGGGEVCCGTTNCCTPDEAAVDPSQTATEITRTITQALRGSYVLAIHYQPDPKQPAPEREVEPVGMAGSLLRAYDRQRNEYVLLNTRYITSAEPTGETFEKR